MGSPSPRERVAKRLQDVKNSRIKAEEASKWTAASSFSDAEDRLMNRLIELEAMEAEEADQVAADSDPRALIGEIVACARDLPSYLLDDLIDSLEELRVCE